MITPLAFLDRDFNFVRVNEAYAKDSGKSPGEFLGHNHFELYPNEENKAIFQKVVETKSPYRVSAKAFIFPDHPEWGVTYWDWSLTPVLSETGEVEFLVLSLNDVTEEARANEEPEKRDAAQSVLSLALPIGVCYGQGWPIILGNLPDRRFDGAAGNDRTDARPVVDSAQTDPMNGRPHGLTRARFRSTKSKSNASTARKGHLFNSALPIRDARNNIGPIISIRISPGAGKARRGWNRRAPDLARDAILVRDPDFKITFWNGGARDIYGWTEEALGKPPPAFEAQFPGLRRKSKPPLEDGHWQGELFHAERRVRIVVEPMGRPPGKNEKTPGPSSRSP